MSPFFSCHLVDIFFTSTKGYNKMQKVFYILLTSKFNVLYNKEEKANEEYIRIKKFP